MSKEKRAMNSPSIYQGLGLPFDKRKKKEAEKERKKERKKKEGKEEQTQEEKRDDNGMTMGQVAGSTGWWKGRVSNSF